MKSLVVFYSKTGNTKKIGEEIAKRLKADVDEVRDLKKRSGFLNWFRAGRDGMRKALTNIEFSKDPKKYDLVVIGTPVWGWNMVPAVRTYMEKNKGKFKKVAFFSTSGGTNVKQTFEDMISGSKKPVAMLSVVEKELKERNYGAKLNAFVKMLK